jgi:multisubunit Na+/H+ antiporter MnhG subunit
MKASRTNCDRLNRLTTTALFGGPVAALTLFVAAAVISNAWALLASVAVLVSSPVIATLSAVASSRMGRRITNELFLHRLEKGL